jgi:hypothetical protein
MTTTADTALPTDDYDTELLPLPRRRRLPFITALLALGLVAAIAFIGGVEIQKHYGATATGAAAGAAAGRAGFAARFAGAGGAPAGGFGGAGAGGVGSGPAAGGSSTGIVTAIKGSTLYVTDLTGNTLKVKAGSAKVQRTVSGSVKTLHPGDTITLQGPKQKDGSYRATTITLGTSAFGGGNQ